MLDQMETQQASTERLRFPCVGCGSETMDGPGFCLQCLTPIELSRSVENRGTAPQFITVLGPSGAGKTVFLGMLMDILSQGSRGLRGLPNGTFSVSVQQQTMSALERRRFPEKTPSEADHWKWVHCEVAQTQRKNRYFDLITPDVAGEAIALEIEEEGTFETIRCMVRKSAAFLLVIDAQRVRDAGRDEDFFVLKLASYLKSQRSAHSKRKLDFPLAVILSKADRCPEAADSPTEFVQANLPGLHQFCERHMQHSQFFATSVVGSTTTIIDANGQRLNVPLHIEPRGVLEPLEWIVERLK